MLTRCAFAASANTNSQATTGAPCRIDSSHHYRDLIGGTRRLRRYRAVDRLTIQRNRLDALLHSTGIGDRDLERGATPLPRHLETLPLGRYARIDDQPRKTQPDAEDPARRSGIIPSSAAGQPRMPGAAESCVVPSHHELAIGVRLRLANLDPVVLVRRQQRVVELHGR